MGVDTDDSVLGRSRRTRMVAGNVRPVTVTGARGTILIIGTRCSARTPTDQLQRLRVKSNFAPPVSWCEPNDFPARITPFSIQQAVVEPIRTPLPELHGIGYYPVTAPVGGPCRCVSIAHLRICITHLQQFAVGQHRALGRRNRREPAPQRPLHEIRIGLGL